MTPPTNRAHLPTIKREICTLLADHGFSEVSEASVGELVREHQVRHIEALLGRREELHRQAAQLDALAEIEALLGVPAPATSPNETTAPRARSVEVV